MYIFLVYDFPFLLQFDVFSLLRVISNVLVNQPVLLAWHSFNSLPVISFCLNECLYLGIFATRRNTVDWKIITGLVYVDFFYSFKSLVSDHRNELVREVKLVVITILDMYDKLEIIFCGALCQARKLINFDRSLQCLACEVTNSIGCNH